MTVISTAGWSGIGKLFDMIIKSASHHLLNFVWFKRHFLNSFATITLIF